MAQENSSYQSSSSFGYRHASACSLKDLMEKINRRVVLHLFAAPMEPDLLFREIENSIALSGDLMYSLIDNEVYKQFNLCQNVEEAEYLRDKLADNLDRMIGYLDSNAYRKKVQRCSEEERLNLHLSEQALCRLWDQINKLLFSQDSIEPEPQWSRPKAKREPAAKVEPSWSKYEQKLSESAASVPHQTQIPAASPDQTPPLPGSGNVYQISEHGINGFITILSLALIIFGAISALSAILSIKNLDLFQVAVFGAIWGLAIVNLVFLFVYYAGKLLKSDIRENTDPQASIFERYAMIFWVDWLLLLVLVSAFWFYLFSGYLSYSWMRQIFDSMPGFFLITGTLILLYICYRSYFWLKKKTYEPEQDFGSVRQDAARAAGSIKNGYDVLKVKVRKSSAGKKRKIGRGTDSLTRPAGGDEEDDDDDYIYK